MLKKFGWATVFAVFGGFCAAPAYALHLPGVGATDGCGQVEDGFAEGCDGVVVDAPMTLYFDIMIDQDGNIIGPDNDQYVAPVYRTDPGPAFNPRPGEVFNPAPATTVFAYVGAGFEQENENEEAAAPSQDNRACAGVPLSLRYILCPNNL